MAFSNRLKKIMSEKKLKAVDLANLLKVTESHVSMLLNGKNNPSNNLIKLISVMLDADEEWLLTGISKKKKPQVPIIKEEPVSYVVDGQTEDNNEASEIDNLLCAARRVLTSGTRHAIALKENILSFDEAVEDKKIANKHPPCLPEKRVGGRE